MGEPIPAANKDSYSIISIMPYATDAEGNWRPWANQDTSGILSEESPGRKKEQKKKKRPDELNRNMHHRRMNARTQAQEGITNAQDMK